jgi:hypothetical protein
MKKIKMNEKVVKDIIKTRNIIRKKYEALKSGKLENESHFEQIFRPITTPLNKLVDVTEEKQPIKSELNKLPTTSADIVDFDSPLRIKKKQKKKKKKKIMLEDEITKFERTSTPVSMDIQSFPNEFNQSLEEEPSSIVQSDLDSTANIQKQQQFLDVSQVDLTEKFISLLNIDQKDFDHKYGPRFNKTDNVWQMGSSHFSMDKHNVFVNDKVYDLTPGLKFLIFFKKPDVKQCDQNDISKYLEIVEESNLLHRNYDKTQQFAGNKSYKYNFIRNLFQHSHTGSGLMQYSTNKIDYVYWDNCYF